MSAAPKQLLLPVEPAELKDDEKQSAGHKRYLTVALPVFRAAVDRTTAKECHELFDVQPSGLSEALTGTSTRGRHVHLEWLIQLLLWGNDAAKHELLAMLLDLAGYKPPERKVPLTESDDVRIARQVLRKYPGAFEMYEAEKDRYQP